MNDLQSVALGEADADLVVTGGRVCLPEMGEFQSRDVVVVDDRVAALPEDASPVVGEDTRVVTAGNRVVAPGFVDAHTHLDLHQTFENAYHYAIEGGTTTVVSEVTGYGPAFGAEGVEQFLAATSYLPVRVRAVVPPQPLLDTFEPRRADDEDAEALADLLADDRVVGVGETDWIHAVGRDTPAELLYQRADAEGKTVSGHAAGCSGEKFAAFATIIDDDHEAISGEDVVTRVENGVHAIGRYGSIRDDMAAIGDAYAEVPTAELSLSSDGMWPRELIDEGYMDAVVRRAIEEGVDPADAIRMATLNPARHFGLDDEGVGSLSPGSVADIVLIDDLDEVNVTTVVSGGEVVYNKGESTVAPRNHEYPDRFYDSVNVSPDPEQFRVPADAASGGDEGASGEVRAIECQRGLLSGETTVSPPVEGDELVADPDADVLKATLLDRHPRGDVAERRSDGSSESADSGGAGGFTGFLTGFGLDAGAVATSVVWETPGVLAVGANDADMRTAVGHVAETGGGWAVVEDGDVVAELPTRVAGVCADLEVEETAKLYDAVDSALRRLGADGDRPMLTLQTLAFAGVPSLKLSFSGYADILNRRVVGLTP
ncbi:adenine deaminase C-terminal domain-containing protein [Halorussus sp. MSC15.2]|uniref:adenine deaminase C-terminal domain-containing protein n=1 Tax=Halorussus sp. MSC15.2 TaxID=2283638 RepID=UPI0013D70966|nr:adenine deaminase C-terminal domain-containing protein [Halorussus sp. MSC15.2]NEU56256.1 adenine deaminase [Halorussus sp. MSC15.2]